MNIKRFLDTATLHIAMRELEWAIPARSRWIPYIDDTSQRELIRDYKDMPEEPPAGMEVVVVEDDPAEINSWLETRSFRPFDFSSLGQKVRGRLMIAAAYQLLIDLDGEFQVSEDSIFEVAGLSGELYSVPFMSGTLYLFRPGADLLDSKDPAVAVNEIANFISFGEISPIQDQYQLSDVSVEGESDLGWMIGAGLASILRKDEVQTIVMAKQQFGFELHPDFLEVTIATVIVVEPDGKLEEASRPEIQEEEIEYTGFMWVVDDSEDTVVVAASLVDL